MPPMVILGSEAAHQTPEQSFQTPTHPTNGLPTLNQHIFVDSQGLPLNICVSQTVLDRGDVERKIKEHGGISTDDESKATIKLGVPGRSTQEQMFSVQWVHDCIEAKKILEYDTLTYRLGVANRINKTIFTRDEDKLLEDFIAVKKAEHASLNGNRIYEDFANKHNQHTAQSWRNRAIKALNLTSRQSPYELGKAKREAARRRQQEKLAADKLMLEVTQQEILDQNLQATRDANPGSEYKPMQASPKSKQQNQQPLTSTGGTSERRLQVIDGDSDEESPLRSTDHFSEVQHSQQAILVFSDIESTDEEDRLHKIERDAIAHRRSYPNPQMSTIESYASQTQDETTTPSQKGPFGAIKSPSPPPPSPRLAGPRDFSSTIDKHSKQHQEDTRDAPSGGYPYNRNGAAGEVSDHDDPFLDCKDNPDPSENKGTGPSPNRNSGTDNTQRNNGNGNSNSTNIHSTKNSNNNVNIPSTSNQLVKHTGIDTGLIDSLEDDNIHSIYQAVGSDDDSDYSEPKGFKPIPQSRKSVKRARTRPATLSPKAKDTESPDFLQDLTRRQNARRSLPNRSWNQDILPSNNDITVKILPVESFDDENANSDMQNVARTPTEGDQIAAQDPHLSPSLPTWRNSPQAGLSIPDTLPASIQSMSGPECQQEEHATGDSQAPAASSDAQEIATVESTEEESLTKDLEDASVRGDLQDGSMADDWQDDPVVDDHFDKSVVQESTGEPGEATPFQEADVSDQDVRRNLTDEDDIAIEQRILQKHQVRHLSPLKSGEKRLSLLVPTSPNNSTTPKAQEANDLEDDHTAYELPAKLLSHVSAQQYQTPSSHTAWIREMPFQVKELHSEREGNTSAADVDLGSRDVSGPASREASSFDGNDGESQDEVQIDRLSNSVQIKVTGTWAVVETVRTVGSTVINEIEAHLSGHDRKDGAVGETKDLVQVEQEEDADTAQAAQERAQGLSKAASSVTPKARGEQDTRESSVLSSLSQPKDVMQDYYSGEGNNESLEKRREREQLLLYLRDLYRKEIRTLMLHELVPALRSIDVLDACSGDFELAKLLISKGMTEDIETRFWTREDDCRLFSSSEEDVKGLLERHSAVELIQRTRYLMRTREEARQFEVALDAMEKSGLLKRVRGRFGGRESKRVRLDGGDS
ncbi:hypothetical protein BGZ95_003204 [Linnemannia exigua]|uniref:Telomeric repeat-binding factor 2-interacting protein 1 n=1 Tax=Linnemannia exigua TaxID=604196 RepID=A0AAD4D696_9FUNG|nr:hypothetical protein BGZ95_003204 [Linnemannia exigua]